MGGRHPVDGALHASPLAIAPHRRGVVLAADLDDLARGILLEVGALDNIGIAEAHLRPGREPEVFLRGDLAEVVLLDPELAAEQHLARTSCSSLRLLITVCERLSRANSICCGWKMPSVSRYQS